MFNLIYNYFYPPQEELKDFYYLSLIKEQDGSFSIHGLWPQTTPDNYPTFCKKVNFDIDCLFPIMGQLKKYWYSTMGKNDNFWKHEWQKHGSCVWTEMNEFEYFSNALRLYHNANENGLPAKYFNPQTKKCLIPVNKELEFINS
jgi:ribonuclease I